MGLEEAEKAGRNDQSTNRAKLKEIKAFTYGYEHFTVWKKGVNEN